MTSSAASAHATAKPNGSKPGPFVAHAHQLIENGYSPLAIKPGTKRPLCDKWDSFRTEVIKAEEIDATAQVWPAAGLAVAGGYNGLVPIDVDTEDEAIRAIIRKKLPTALVVKKGNRGATAFYRGRVRARKLLGIAGHHLVEVLTSGQAVVPPTVHPDTRQPYRWMTERTLFNTRVDELPEVTEADLTRLEEELKPYLKPQETYKNANGAAHKASGTSDKRLRAYAESALDDEAKKLAGMGQGSGRNRALYDAACKLGNYVHHGVLTEGEVRTALLAACDADGLLKDDGLRQCEASITSGLKKAKGDPLREPPDDGPHSNGHDTGRTRGKQDEQRTSHIRLVPFGQIKLNTSRRELIKGLLPRTGLAVIWGPPKCGKSYKTFDMMMHVALGRDYRDRRVQQGPVVYCAFEGASGLEARIEAWRQKHLAEDADADEVPFYLMPATLDLVKERGELIEAIKQLDINPVAIVLDTLNRSLVGSESNDEDMGKYIRASDALREAFDCLVAVVHHCGHNGERPRGHTSLVAAADAVLSVKKEAAGRIIMKVDMMKDGPEGEMVASRLLQVTVGEDEDGDLMTTCVVVPVDTPSQAQEARLTPNLTTMFSILHEAGASGLTTEEWYERARKEGLGVRRPADLYDFRRNLKAKKLARAVAGKWVVDR
jgi:hypothetical protein